MAERRQLRSVRVGPPAAFVRCRVLRHAWEVTGEVEHPSVGRLVSLLCTSCGTMRYDSIDLATGERLRAPQYAWPDGYRDVGEGHDRDWYRTVWAEDLYAAGLLKSPPRADTRRRRA